MIPMFTIMNMYIDRRGRGSLATLVGFIHFDPEQVAMLFFLHFANTSFKPKGSTARKGSKSSSSYSVYLLQCCFS